MTTTPIPAERPHSQAKPLPKRWFDTYRTRPVPAIQQQPSRRRVTVGVILWFVGAIALAILSVAAHAYPEFPGDIGLTVFVQQLHQPQIVAFINIASDVNWPKQAGIISIATLIILVVSRHIRAAFSTAISAYSADGANILINGAVARPRPNNIAIHSPVHVGLHSFPSGHVSHCLAFYGFVFFLCMVAARHHPNWRPWLRLVQVICGALIGMVGISRVLEGQHWPSDVLGGYLLGTLCLTLGIGAYHLLWRIFPRRSSGAQLA